MKQGHTVYPFIFACFTVAVNGFIQPLHSLSLNRGTKSFPEPSDVLGAPLARTATVPRGRLAPLHGLFGLGAPEIVVIIAVAAFVLGPEKLAEYAKDAGKGLGEMQEVPKGFNEGFAEGSTSDEVKKIARDLGKSTNTLKDTAVDLAGDYSAVASEFAEGVRQASQEVNRDLVGGLEEANSVVADTRSGIKDLKEKISSKDAEVVKKDA